MGTKELHGLQLLRRLQTIPSGSTSRMQTNNIEAISCQCWSVLWIYSLHHYINEPSDKTVSPQLLVLSWRYPTHHKEKMQQKSISNLDIQEDTPYLIIQSFPLT